MELLLCNQAVISHHQPITKLSFLKQFVYRKTYKSWLTLQGKLHWVGSRQRARASSQVLYWSHWCWQGGELVALSQVGKSSLPRQRGVSSAGSVILCTFLYGMGVFPEITVTNSNDEPSLHAGIFPKRFCMLEVGTDLQEGYLTALTTPFPLQWDHPPFLQVGFLQGSPSQRNPKHHGCKESCCLLGACSCPSGNELCLLQALLHWCNCEGAAAAVLTIPASVECQHISA